MTAKAPAICSRISQPRAGWRHVVATERRTAPAFAYRMHELAYVHFPPAEKLRLVVDNLNTHTPAAFYKSLSLLKHDAWPVGLSFTTHPNMGVGLIWSKANSRCCRVNDWIVAFQRSSNCAVRSRCGKLNATRARLTVNWQFKTVDARTKLKRLYPS